jgi:MFS superfamily sulfate permease-like transporter
MQEEGTRDDRCASVFAVQGPLCFANAQRIKEFLIAEAVSHPQSNLLLCMNSPCPSSGPCRWVCACELLRSALQKSVVLQIYSLANALQTNMLIPVENGPTHTVLDMGLAQSDLL